MFNQQLEWKPWPRMYSSFTFVCCTNAYCSPVCLVLCYEMNNHLFLASVKDNLLYQTSEKHVWCLQCLPCSAKMSNCHIITVFTWLWNMFCFVFLSVGQILDYTCLNSYTWFVKPSKQQQISNQKNRYEMKCGFCETFHLYYLPSCPPANQASCSSFNLASNLTSLLPTSLGPI